MALSTEIRGRNWPFDPTKSLMSRRLLQGVTIAPFDVSAKRV
jgi:hypothetical protein